MKGQTCPHGRTLSSSARVPHHGATMPSSWFYIFAWAGTLADQLFGWHLAGLAAGVAIIVFLLLEFPRQRPAVRVLFVAMAVVGLLGVAFSGDRLGTFFAAWRRGAAYAAFFFALGCLRDAAETSPIVRRCGAHLVAQPPGRRYAAVSAGGHLFGIILSYGAIELFGAMVARANTLVASGGSEVLRANRARRMMLAAYRGFACMNCWSPLNIMTAVVSAAVPAANLRPLLPLAFAISLGMLAIGWALDRASAPEAAQSPAPAERWSIHLRIAALVLTVMALAEATGLVFDVSLSTGVTAVLPVVGLVWAAVQARSRARPAVALAMLGRRLARFRLRVPSFRGEATILATGGFMGVALGAALPASGMTQLLLHLPAAAVPLLVPPVLIATGLLGLNPIVVVAVIGAAVPDPASLGVAPAVLAFACMLGWGVAVGMTPMSASAITTARWAGSDPWTVSVAWNGVYTAAAWLLATLAILAAHLAWS